MINDQKNLIEKKTRYEKNPFLNFTVTANKRRMTVAKGSVIKTLNNDGEIDENSSEMETTISQIKLVDHEQFVKFFTSQISSIFDLTSPGLKIFTLLLLEAQKNVGGDMVFLSKNIISKLAKTQQKSIAAATYFRGISNLIDAKIIAPATLGSGWFYINPAIIFNGDRARFVVEYQKPKTEKKINKNQQNLSFYNEQN